MAVPDRSPTPLADLLLHPIRFRITRQLLGRELTTAELKRDLPDVPPTTLYRHVAALIDAGYVSVVRERQVRGTTERTLALDQTTAARIGADEARAMTIEQHRQALLLLLSGLGADFDQLAGSGELYDRLEQLGYSQVALYLDPGDQARLREALRKAVEPYLREAPGKDRVMYSLIALPDPTYSPPEAS